MHCRRCPGDERGRTRRFERRVRISLPRPVSPGMPVPAPLWASVISQYTPQTSFHGDELSPRLCPSSRHAYGCACTTLRESVRSVPGVSSQRPFAPSSRLAPRMIIENVRWSCRCLPGRTWRHVVPVGEPVPCSFAFSDSVACLMGSAVRSPRLDDLRRRLRSAFTPTCGVYYTKAVNDSRSRLRVGLSFSSKAPPGCSRPPARQHSTPCV